MSIIKNVVEQSYKTMLINDYLRSTIREAGFSHMDIKKTPTGTRVALYVAKPGVAIGRKGAGIREITERLEADFGLKSPRIDVAEIKVPELSPSVMCNRMASHLERGTAFRRATMWTIKQVMERGAMGVQITISGKLRGDRSAFEKHTEGVLPRAGHHADLVVDEDIVHVNTPMGLVGVRIRIAKKDRVRDEFRLKEAAPAGAKNAPAAKEAPVKDAADPAKGGADTATAKDAAPKEAAARDTAKAATVKDDKGMAAPSSTVTGPKDTEPLVSSAIGDSHVPKGVALGQDGTGKRYLKYWAARGEDGGLGSASGDGGPEWNSEDDEE